MRKLGLATGSALLSVCALWGAASGAQAAQTHHASAVVHKKAAAAVATSVTISTGQSVGVVPPLAYGMNTAVWDANLFSSTVNARLKELGIKMLRWPGGSTSDQYQWNSAMFEFQDFMQMAKQVGATPMLTVNYGTGTPGQAAAWVQYVKAHHENALWEIGNEQYGDGEYQGVTWEADYHQDKSPAGYGKNSLKYIAAMRKVDPQAQIGIVATIPTVWPSGIKPYWDRTLLPIVGKEINFVVIHWYPQNPGQESDSGLLETTAMIPSYMDQLKAYIKQYCGANAKNIKIYLDETNSVSSNPGKQMMSVVNALFLANDYNTWLENGVANVSWWDLHNNAMTGDNNSTSLYGTATYGDYGILSAGDTGEPPLNTPTASYWGYRMVSLFAQPGDRYVGADSNQPMVDAYAALKGKKEAAVMLVNTDPSSTYSVSLRGLNVAPNSIVTEFTYGAKTPGIEMARVRYGSGQVTVPAYTMVVVDVPTK